MYRSGHLAPFWAWPATDKLFIRRNLKMVIQAQNVKIWSFGSFLLPSSASVLSPSSARRLSCGLAALLGFNQPADRRCWSTTVD